MWQPRLQPSTLQHATFRAAMIGYAAVDVDEFLDLVAQQLTWIHQVGSQPHLWGPLELGPTAMRMLCDLRESDFRRIPFGYDQHQVNTLLDRAIADLQRLIHLTRSAGEPGSVGEPAPSPSDATAPVPPQQAGVPVPPSPGEISWTQAPAPPAASGPLFDGSGPLPVTSTGSGPLSMTYPGPGAAALVPAAPRPDMSPEPYPQPAPSFMAMSQHARYTTALLRPAMRPSAPGRRLVVVTCMDARIDTARTFGLDIGDAHVLRNAGGRVTDDVLRSLAVSTGVLDTCEIAVIQHQGCGMATASDDELRARVQGRTGWLIPPVHMYAISDLTVSLHEDVSLIAASPLLARNIPVWGAVLDLECGLEGVVCAWTHRPPPGVASLPAPAGLPVHHVLPAYAPVAGVLASVR